MAYTGKPVFHFIDLTSTGVDKLAIEALIFTEIDNKLYTKVNNDGLTGASTVQDAITGGNFIDIVATTASGGNLKSDGSVEMDVAYTPTADQDIATKVSVDDAVAAGGGGNLKSDGSIEMDAAYTPTADQDIATKVSVDDAIATGSGNLKSDGSVEMDVAYTPTADQDIATKVSVDDAIATSSNNSLIFDSAIFGGQ